MWCNYLIVGQGIAGSILDFLLQKHGVSTMVLDNGHKNCASKVAAGIVNPLTGRKYVKSWMIDQLVPDIIDVYDELSELLEMQTYRPINILRALHSIKEENEWEIKSNLEGNLHYCVPDADLETYRDFLKIEVAYGELKGYQVFLPKIVEAYAQHLEKSNRLTFDSFDFDQLEIFPDHISYKGVEAENIIFAEGHRAKQNPYFSHLAMEPSKGEVLFIKVKNPLSINKILKHKMFFVPVGERIFWVGSGYEWEFENEDPTQEERKKMIATLDRILADEYEVVDHKAAVRPTVLDRRPFIGAHYTYDNMYVFNGFGTKGSSLVPFWAKHFVDHLTREKELSSDVSPDR